MDVEKRESEAVQAALGPQRLARDGDYGFCCYGDASPAIGGGIPVFFWFEDGPAMLDFLKRHAPFLNPPRSDIDLTELDSTVRVAVANADPNDLETLRKRLNELLDGCTQFTWIGSFEELKACGHPEAQLVRNHFHSENGRPEDGAAIRKDEVSEFTEFLSAYGV
jgi:hypothetical protein